MMRNRLYTKDEVLQVVEAALSALNHQSAPIQEPVYLDNSTSQQSSPGTKKGDFEGGRSIYRPRQKTEF